MRQRPTIGTCAVVGWSHHAFVQEPNSSPRRHGSPKSILTANGNSYLAGPQKRTSRTVHRRRTPWLNHSQALLHRLGTRSILLQPRTCASHVRTTDERIFLSSPQFCRMWTFARTQRRAIVLSYSRHTFQPARYLLVAGRAGVMRSADDGAAVSDM